MRRSALTLCALLVAGLPAHAQPDPLPSWNEGPAKRIFSFHQLAGR